MCGGCGRLCAVLTVLFSLAVPQRLWATTVLAESFPDLVHKAEVIAVGTVTGINNHWDAARRAPFTVVTFSNLNVLKGTTEGDTLSLYFLGGITPKGHTISVHGVPRFSIGEKNIVFCAGNQRNFSPLVGVWQGRLRIAFDTQRQVETVRDNFHAPILGVQNGQFLKKTPGSPALQQQPVSLSSFLQLIQNELGKELGKDND